MAASCLLSGRCQKVVVVVDLAGSLSQVYGVKLEALVAA